MTTGKVFAEEAFDPKGIFKCIQLVRGGDVQCLSFGRQAVNRNTIFVLLS